MIDQTLVIVGPNGLRFYDQDGTRGNAFFFVIKSISIYVIMLLSGNYKKFYKSFNSSAINVYHLKQYTRNKRTGGGDLKLINVQAKIIIQAKIWSLSK